MHQLSALIWAKEHFTAIQYDEMLAHFRYDLIHLHLFGGGTELQLRFCGHFVPSQRWYLRQLENSGCCCRELPEGGKSKQYTASHLCIISPFCWRRGHVMIESQDANNRRQRCVGTIECSKCGEKFSACPHDPECVPVA